VPKEFAKQSLPPYVVEPPDILLIRAVPAVSLATQPLDGQHLVRPDGSIDLGIYGTLWVAGLRVEQVAEAVAQLLKVRVEKNKDLSLEQIRLGLQVDVLAYNSKWYYVITDGGGYGEQVTRVPATGNETVLDAISQIYGLPPVASKKKIWVARAVPGHAAPNILPVDWCGITQRGEAETNYQLFPGDRLYVASDHWIATDSWLAKRLAPVERLLGVTLLGSSTVNSIRNRGSGTSGQ
jgi:polysaccharide export outer membrane protein